ncbi:MAG: pyrroline-5-carboxylate reductase [Melioribacteraceae bacterium]|nr:MAG: pyrroline-5-carboxylate reductase [Melioribacteraceae bacterium]
MNNRKIAVIGAGNLGLSILNGLIEYEDLSSGNIIATKRNILPIKHLEKEGVTITNDNEYAVKNADIIIVTVKPYNILALLGELKPHFDPSRHIVVSAATGVSVEELRSVLGEDLPVFRAMPNTAADVKQSVTCLCSDNYKAEDMETVMSIFNIVGTSIVIDENLMESATVLGACGIAYVLRFIRAMIQGGIQIGFDAKTANEIVTQTVRGASELLIQRNQHPEHEIDKVTTPKGCTIVGLNEMEHNGFSSSLIKGLVASFEKIEK